MGDHSSRMGNSSYVHVSMFSLFPCIHIHVQMYVHVHIHEPFFKDWDSNYYVHVHLGIGTDIRIYIMVQEQMHN